MFVGGVYLLSPSVCWMCAPQQPESSLVHTAHSTQYTQHTVHTEHLLSPSVMLDVCAQQRRADRSLGAVWKLRTVGVVGAKHHVLRGESVSGPTLVRNW
jgi:hypothetical protein